MTRVTSDQVETALADLPDWSKDGDTLRTTYTFKNFNGAMEFVNRVAKLAGEAHHHPEICIDYNRVRLGLTTHDEGGLTDKDLALARRITEQHAG